MLNFNEFLAESTDLITEAGVRMTKDKWRSAMDMVPREDRGDFMKFSASVQKLYGIDTNNAKEYYKVQAAFKTLTGKDTGPAKAPAKPAAPKPVAAPKAAPAPKAPPAKAEPAIPKGGFNVKPLQDKLAKLRNMIYEVGSEADKLDKEFKALRGNRNINNLADPALMELYNAIEDLKYLGPIEKEVMHRQSLVINLGRKVEAARKELAKAK